MTTFAERARQGITRCTVDDLPALRSFQQGMYGRSEDIPTAAIDWLFSGNPHRSSGDLGLWICRRSGTIVGQQAELAFRLRAGDDELLATAAIELVVDPQWRLRGVGHALSAIQQENARLVCSLGMSDDAAKMYRRRHWLDLGTIPEHLFVVRPDVVRELLETRSSRRLAAARPAVWGFAAATTALARRRRWSTTLLPIRHFDEWADRVWAGASGAHQVIARRDAASLEWRFDRSPHAPLYLRHYLVRNGLPIGYVVLRRSTWRGAPSLKVVDYLVPTRWTAALLAHCIVLARDEGVAVVDLATRNAPAAAHIRSLGFLPAHLGTRDDGASGIRFMAAIADDDPARGLVAHPDAWFVTSGDADLEFVDLSVDAGDGATPQR